MTLDTMSLICAGGSFTLPKSTLTRNEMRSYILTELRNWLCGSKMTSTVDHLIAEDFDISSFTQCTGSIRMYKIVRQFVGFSDGFWGARDIAQVCYGICANHLQNLSCPFNDETKNMVLEFLDEPLSNGLTVRTLWDHSPFESLRNADPLPEEDEDDVDVEVSSIEDNIEVVMKCVNLYSLVVGALVVAYCSIVVLM
jgi:hypothetical protein